MNNVNIVVLHTVRILGLISVFEVGVWKELSELLFSLFIRFGGLVAFS